MVSHTLGLTTMQLFHECKLDKPGARVHDKRMATSTLMTLTLTVQARTPRNLQMMFCYLWIAVFWSLQIKKSQNLNISTTKSCSHVRWDQFHAQNLLEATSKKTKFIPKNFLTIYGIIYGLLGKTPYIYPRYQVWGVTYLNFDLAYYHQIWLKLKICTILYA